MDRPIRRALISVFHKEGLAPIVEQLQAAGVEILSTGGTQRAIEALGAEVTPVESVTQTAEMLGGRVKTLHHPMVFGGILARRDFEADDVDVAEHGIGRIDLVIVDLYPFEETLASGPTRRRSSRKSTSEASPSSARPPRISRTSSAFSRGQYADLVEALSDGMSTDLDFRRRMAEAAFGVSSGYDAAIGKWVREGGQPEVLSLLETACNPLRYGENPHQEGAYFGVWTASSPSTTARPSATTTSSTSTPPCS